MLTFDELNLSPNLRRAIADLGFTTPTPIQERTFSVAMSGRDVLGIAQTGTGKTLAYLLPCLRQWKYLKDRGPYMLILVPTRELVDQVLRSVQQLGQYMQLKAVGVYGGTNIRTQMAEVASGMDVLVATPGRLIDLALNGAIKLRNVKKLVIDEVDEMLNLGFRAALTQIFDLMPPKRQNLLFSATLPDIVEALMDEFFNDPLRIEASPVGTPLDNIAQIQYQVPNFNTKLNLLEFLISDAEVFNKVLVFTATKQLADQLYEPLSKEYEGQVGVIHSNKDQNYRFQSVKNFQEGITRLLIATDVIARGIDISEVSHVINLDVPPVPEHYIHRIGRTGRADRKGIAITLVTPGELEDLKAIEDLMKYQIPELPVPEDVPISNVLTAAEMPIVHMKEIKATIIPRDESNAAFHAKSLKNSKTNQKVRYSDKMKVKYGKPKTRGQKRKK